LKKTGWYLEATQEFRSALLIDSTMAKAHENLAVVLFLQQNFKEAEMEHEKAIQLDPSYAIAYMNMGVLYKTLGDNQKALQMFQKAVELDPCSPKIHYNMALHYEKLKEYDKALQSYQKSISLDNNYLLAIKSFQNLLTKMGKTKEAQSEYLDYINTRSKKSLKK
jgi:tetratricopeptide (TPR) repeat protein